LSNCPIKVLLARDLPTSIMLCEPPAKVPPPDERGASPLAALRLLRTTAGDQCRAADIASRVGHSAGVNSARGRSPLCPAAPRNGGKATEAHAEQPEGCWLGHCGVLKTVDASVLGEKVVIRTPSQRQSRAAFFPHRRGLVFRGSRECGTAIYGGSPSKERPKLGVLSCPASLRYARSRQAGPQKRDHGRAGRKSASHASQWRVSTAGSGASALRPFAGHCQAKASCARRVQMLSRLGKHSPCRRSRPHQVAPRLVRPPPKWANHF
jgi:hypothetical protein